MLKTKIICTIGPASSDEVTLRKLIRMGMNVARLNFSHGTHEEHRVVIDRIKRIRAEENKFTAILLDTKGPEIRTGVLNDGSAELISGNTFILTSRDILGDENAVSVTFHNLPRAVSEGDVILLDDGMMELAVQSVNDTDIICTVVTGGTLKNRKGINIPGVSTNMEYLSPKDTADILFGIENDVDFIAASFVRNVDDVESIRRFLDENGGKDIKIISKIENIEGITNIDSIIEKSDGVMVARGDLGVEIPFEDVPVVQKMLLHKCHAAGKIGVTATQMLDSMIRNPRPTRAEVTDVANAVYDSTGAIMLSGETASGQYPVESFETMRRIAETAEMDINYEKRFRANAQVDLNYENAIAHAACMTAYDIKADAILAITSSGLTARLVSAFRPTAPIISTAASYKTCYQLSLSWGVYPVHTDEQTDIDEALAVSIEDSKKAGLLHKGNVIVQTCGYPLGQSGTTNTLRIHKL